MTAMSLSFKKVALVAFSLMWASSVVVAQEVSAVATQAVKILLQESVPGFEAAGKDVKDGEVVAKGDAEVGFQQVSELRHVVGATFAGILPAGIQNSTTYAGGVHTNAKSPGQAMALLKHLKSVAVLASVRKAGVEPVGAL